MPADAAFDEKQFEKETSHMHIKLTIAGQELEVPPLKLKASFERIVKEHKLESHADRIAAEVMDALAGNTQTLDPSKLGEELKIDPQEAGVLLAWVHFMCQYRMMKQSQAAEADKASAAASQAASSTTSDDGPIFPPEVLTQHEEAKKVDWFATWSAVSDHVTPQLKASDTILLIGCTEKFAEALRNAGFSNLTTLSVQQALSKFELANESVDVVIERTAVDDIFHLGQDMAGMNRGLNHLWCESWDVLRPGGRYISLNVCPIEGRKDWFSKWAEGIAKNIGQEPWAAREVFEFTAGEDAPEAAQALTPVGMTATKGDSKNLKSVVPELD